MSRFLRVSTVLALLLIAVAGCCATESATSYPRAQAARSAHAGMNGGFLLRVDDDQTVNPSPETDAMVKLYINGRATKWNSHDEVRSGEKSRIRLVAKPAKGYRFLYWKGLPDSVALKEIPKGIRSDIQGLGMEPRVSFVRGNSFLYVVAVFSKRPAGEPLDLLADYQLFLKEFHLTETDAEIEAFDRGGIKFKAKQTEPDFVGDGWPDIIPFAMVNRILKQRTIEYDEYGGVSGSTVWNEYQRNLGILERAFPMVNQTIRRAAAVFAMLSHHSNWWVCSAVRQRYGVQLPNADFNLVAERWLRADNDADMDGFTNAEEWKCVLDTSVPNTPMKAKLERYAEISLDRSQPPKK